MYSRSTSYPTFTGCKGLVLYQITRLSLFTMYRFDIFHRSPLFLWSRTIALLCPQPQAALGLAHGPAAALPSSSATAAAPPRQERIPPSLPPLGPPLFLRRSGLPRPVHHSGSLPAAGRCRPVVATNGPPPPFLHRSGPPPPSLRYSGPPPPAGRRRPLSWGRAGGRPFHLLPGPSCRSRRRRKSVAGSPGSAGTRVDEIA